MSFSFVHSPPLRPGVCRSGRTDEVWNLFLHQAGLPPRIKAPQGRTRSTSTAPPPFRPSPQNMPQKGTLSLDSRARTRPCFRFMTARVALSLAVAAPHPFIRGFYQESFYPFFFLPSSVCDGSSCPSTPFSFISRPPPSRIFAARPIYANAGFFGRAL